MVSARHIAVCILLFACVSLSVQVMAQQKTRIAFISDIHIHNIYPDKDTALLHYFYDSTTGKTVLIRTLESEMNSTRLFNENYYALKQALNNIARQGIKLVIIPGDYSDDGQLVNLLLVRDILAYYQEKFQMRFLITNGNHDVEPFAIESGKKDFLGPGGQATGVYSSASLKTKPTDQVYPLLKVGGYKAVFDILQPFGFLPNKKDLFYHTPHHPFQYETYQYDSSLFSFKSRLYAVGKDSVANLSYVCEPVKDIWVMAIDGNIFERGRNGAFENIGDGYQFMGQKNFLHAWIQLIVSEAKKRSKTLIAFSHYPMLDFNNGQSNNLEAVIGKGKFQLNRVPEEKVQRILAATGLPLHFAGHMHINQHGYFKNDNQSALWNIQVPSLAAFPPAYKIAGIDKEKISITTHPLKTVENYNTLFRYYAQEQKTTILSGLLTTSPDYYTFTRNHLQYLAENRFYNNDFNNTKWDRFKNSKAVDWKPSTFIQQLNKRERDTFLKLRFKDIVFDLYLVRNANDLGIREIPKARLQLYRKWVKLIDGSAQPVTALDELVTAMQQLMNNSLQTRKTIIRFSKN